MTAPRIRTKPQSDARVREILEKIKKYANPASGHPHLAEYEWPVIWERGEGATIIDPVGNVYIDLDCYAVNLLGHANPVIIDAIRDQSKRLIHAKSRCLTPLQGELAETLVKLAQEEPLSEGLDRVQFTVTGSGAVEFAMKLAVRQTGRKRFLAFHGAYHGSSQGASAITCAKKATDLIASTTFVPYAYCYRCPFGKEYPGCETWCVKYLEYLFDDPATGLPNEDIAAIVIEPVQGSYGCIVPPDEFMTGVRNVCDKNDVLLISDDIQTGFRLGKYFGVTFWAKPDLVLLGKNLGGGLPLSATLGNSKTFGSDAPTRPFQTSTFMSNLLSFAAGLAFLRHMKKDNIMEREKRLGEYFLKALKDVIGKRKLVGDIRGKGLMLGVELVKDKETKERAREETMEIYEKKLPSKGLIVDIAGHWRDNVIKMTPPAVITEEQIDKVVEILDGILKEYE